MILMTLISISKGPTVSETNIELVIFIAIFIVSIVVLILKAKQKHLDVDCAYGDSHVTDIMKNRESYLAARDLFANIPEDAWDQRYFYSVSFSRVFKLEVLEKWVQDEPQSADAWLVYSAALVIGSWNIRGYGRGNDVSEKKWEDFHQALEDTEVALLKAAKLNPSDPTPWAYLIIIETWGGGDYDSKRQYFSNAIERDPENWIAHIHMVIALSKKWGESNHQRMMRFAKEAAAQARPGSDIPIVLIKAYLELYKFRLEFEDNEKSAVQLLESADVEEKTMEAYNNSLGHPDHRDNKTTIFARYNFSGWMWALDKKDLLKSQFDEMGKSISAVHWLWVGFDCDFKEAKKFAYS